MQVTFKYSIGDTKEVPMGKGKITAVKHDGQNYYKVKTASNENWFPEDYWEVEEIEIVPEEPSQSQAGLDMMKSDE